MFKIVVAIALVFLIAALSILGSPFFAVLLAVPAVLIYLGVVAGRSAQENEAAEAREQAWPARPAGDVDNPRTPESDLSR
jgi:threonine/homoserine/homoserine lactone efflux protein